MSRVLNLSCTLRNSNGLAVRFTRCNFSSDSKQNDSTTSTTTRKGTTDDESIVPLPMSFNSYENLTNVQTTPPILIMHGRPFSQSIVGKINQTKIMNRSPLRSHSGLFGSKQNWRSISKAIHSKTNPTRKVRPLRYCMCKLVPNPIKFYYSARYLRWMLGTMVRVHIHHAIDTSI